MDQPRVLLTLIGNRDPFTEVDEPGPVLSLLGVQDFSRVYLFYTGSSYLERARTVETIAKQDGYRASFHFVDVELASPIDYEEVFHALKRAAEHVLESIGHLGPQVSVLLDPGTPQMQTAWFLLAKSGHLSAKLLQGVPPRFAGGAYKVKTVDLDTTALPKVAISSDGTRESERRFFTGASATAIVGEHRLFREMLERARRVAAYDLTVLISGETGSGKGVVARHIHDMSRRRDRPFVAVNCAALSPTLVESELFGHEKGAFTGAAGKRMGMFRSADGGTVFLDEVGDLPLDIQPKLLRVLEDRSLVPVGGDREESVDVRIIAATNRDLSQMVRAGSFREDLFMRLNQFPLSVPPLRFRGTDIPLLARRFVEQWNAEYGESKEFSEEAMVAVSRYSWPGNVRELHNVVQAVCASAIADTMGPELLPRGIAASVSGNNGSMAPAVRLPEAGINVRAVLHNTERQYFEQALRRAGGNKEQAARLLGISGAAFRKAWRERLGEADGREE